MKTLGMAAVLGCVVWAAGLASGGQDKPKATATDTRDTINADFNRGMQQLERQRLERLARLAATQPPAEADKTYEDYFRNAITTGLFVEAEPTAERVLKSTTATPQVRHLAELVNVVAEANRGAYQESLDSIAAAIQIADRGKGQRPDDKGQRPDDRTLPLPARLSLLNAYYQRLLQGDQFAIARKALQLVRDNSQETAIKDLAVSRLQQLDLIGKPAPPLNGADVDGKPVRLADYKGDVVLIVFWASWCLPNSEEVARFEQVVQTYRGKGFRVLGINLDTLQDGGQHLETVLPNIKRFLLDHNVRWPNLINGPGERDYAKAYGVTEIPANVLIGRDGTVIHLDLTRANLAKVLASVVGR